MQTELEKNPSIRYGFYLRPSFDMSRAQAEIHDLVERQFGYIGGGVFMPHATIKGFFRSDATVDELIGAFGSACEERAPFPVYNAGPERWSKSSICLDVNIMPDGSINQPMKEIHVAAWDAVKPYLDPDCSFCKVEGAYDNFRAHLTLMMADVPHWMGDEMWEFIAEAGQIGPQVFTAKWFHLYAFESADWDGKWWETLEWKLLHSWKLTGDE